MGEAIGAVLPFAVGVAISPMPVVAMVLMLLTPRARSNGVTFVLGWMLGIAVAGAILIAIAGPAGANDEGAPADWVSWLKLLLGILLVLVAVKEWKARPGPDEEVAMPKWMSALDGMTPPKAGGLALLLGTVNPKNLLLIVGGAAAVAQLGAPTSDETMAWIVFTLIATLGIATPLGIYLALGDRAGATLDELKTWMTRNNTAVMAVLCLVIGVKLLGDGIAGL